MKWTGWIGKAVGGLLGWLAAGPLGAGLGVLLGHQFDTQGFGAAAADLAGIGERFFCATFHVMGYVAKQSPATTCRGRCVRS